MDYTSIRKLLYQDRNKLDDFDILDNEASKIEPFLYERLIQLEYLHPKHKYSNEEILRIFNDVFYIVTLFFRDKNPLANYADYRQIANPNNQNDMLSINRQWVELSMIYVILARFNRVEWFKEMKSHSKLFGIIKDEIVKHQNAYTYSALSQLSQGTAIADEDAIIHTLTTDTEGRFFFMRVDVDFAPRNIQEVIDSKESLRDCLFAGDELHEVVNTICKDKEQKLALIDRLLEPEKEGYGNLDTRITESYRCLHELRSELTGESLPEKLPFESFSDSLGLIGCGVSINTDDVASVADELKDPDAIRKRMDELLAEYNRLKEKLEIFSEDETEEDMVEVEDESSDEDYDEEDEWDDQYDDVFKSEINPQKAFEKLEYLDDPRVTEDYPRFFVFFKVLLYIHWINNEQNKFLKWANFHWRRGWDKDYKFKFSNNIDKKIRDAHIAKWGDETLPDISKAYRALAIEVLSKFTEKVNGNKIIDNIAFYNDGVTKRINDGKKLEYPF